MAMCSPFSGSTDLGKLIKASTVKMMLGPSIWTGFVIGSKYNRSLILTIAHEFFRAGEWLTQDEIQRNVRVGFLGDPVPYPCRVVRYLPFSDILLVAVDDKSTESKLTFPPRPENGELVTESELLGSRGHPKGGELWTFVDGHVATPRVVNNRQPEPVLGLYDVNLIYFEHRADMGTGFSGAPLVNVGKFVVGMLTGGMDTKHHAMGTGPFYDFVKAKFTQINEDYAHQRLVREERLDSYQVPGALLKYTRKNIEVIPVPASDVKYIIHAEYLERMLRTGGPEYEQNASLEDIYLAAAPAPVPAVPVRGVPGPSHMQLA